MHRLEKTQLDAFRAAVVDRRAGAALAKAIDKVGAAGPFVIGGASRKSVPRGFDAHHPLAGLLLHEGLWVERERKPDKSIATPAFVDRCAAEFAAMWPVGKGWSIPWPGRESQAIAARAAIH
jgi:hypothetical protein